MGRAPEMFPAFFRRALRPRMGLRTRRFIASVAAVALLSDPFLKSEACPVPPSTSGFGVLSYTFNSTGSTIYGNTGFDSLNPAGVNSTTFNGNLTLGSGSKPAPPNVVNGSTILDPTATLLDAGYNIGISFFNDVQTLGTTQNFSPSSSTINASGTSTVIDVTGTFSGSTLTLKGNSSDVFYFNVSACTFNLTNIVLSGVLASNVYWTFIDGQNVSLSSGTFNGTLLTEGTISLNHETVNGGIYGGDLSFDDSVVKCPGALVPEVSSSGVLGAFCSLLLVSSSIRAWKRKFFWKS